MMEGRAGSGGGCGLAFVVLAPRVAGFFCCAGRILAPSVSNRLIGRRARRVRLDITICPLGDIHGEMLGSWLEENNY